MKSEIWNPQRKTGSRRVLTSTAVVVYVLTITFITAFLAAWPSYELHVSKLLLPAVCVALLSAFGFIKCGRNVVNGSSVTSLGIFLFGGFAGVYTGLGLNDQRAEGAVRGTLVALAFLFAFQLALLVASPRPVEAFQSISKVKEKSAGGGFRDLLGVLAIIICAVGVLLGLKSYVTPLGILGVFILVDSRLGNKSERPKLTGTVVFAAFLMVLYYQFLFAGFGRLVLAVLAIGVVMLFSLYTNTRVLKSFVLVGSLLALPILSLQRLYFLAETRGTAPLESEGLGSVVGPLISFGQLIEARIRGLFEASLGKTLFDTLTLWIPRAWWPEKPQGFGVDIVQFTQPHLVGSYGFTDAAMFGGELVWNFGILGAFISIPAVSYFVFLLNKYLYLISCKPDNLSTFLARIALVVAISALLHYVWAGTYTYLIRIFIILLFLVFLKVFILPLREKT